MSDIEKFETTGTIEDAEKFLMEAGLFYGVFGGIQIDVAVIKRRLEDGKTIEATLCDHNCVEDAGGDTKKRYNCPAAYTLGKGVFSGNFSPEDMVIKGIKNTARAILNSKDYFLGEFLESYEHRFGIPGYVADAMRNILEKGTVEVNLFGGNPELHPGILKMIYELKRVGYKVTLTTTGRRLMTDDAFAKGLLSNPPDVLALTAGDFETPEEIDRLSLKSLEEIKIEWKKVPTTFGQRQKSFESAYAAKLVGDSINVLFNSTIHSGNLPLIKSLTDSIRNNFPNVTINPHMSQSSFQYDEPHFSYKHTEMLETFVDYMIKETIGQIGKHKAFSPRLPYWLMNKAISETYTTEDVPSALSGYGVWKCYENPGAGRYVQIGGSEISSFELPGGHLGCFWNKMASDWKRQVWDMTVDEIGRYIKGGLTEIVKRRARPCPGCVMPRLNFDMMSVETGMNEAILPNYLRLRERYVGF